MNNWLLIILFSVISVPAKGAGLQEPIVADNHNRDEVLKQLLPVLRAQSKAARISFSSVCSGETFPFPIFPNVRVIPTQQRNGLAAVREMFRKDESVAVLQDRSGIIRITIGQPPTALLQTKLRSLNFDAQQQYNGELAVDAVLNAKKVEGAMQELGLEKGVKMIAGSINVPEKGRPLPHLPASIKNMTVDEALDLIAKTFRGIVIYETCSESRGKGLVFLDFVQIAAP